MFNFLRRLAAIALGLFGWGLERCVEWVTRRNFAAERADAQQAEADARDAAAQEAESAARHDQAMAATETQIAETRALRRAIERSAQPLEKPKSPAQRKKEIADQSASHDPVIRSSTWVTEPEPDDEVVVLRVA